MKNSVSINKTFKATLFVFILVMLVIPAPQTVVAESENEMLKQRVEKLERELNELKTLMNEKTTSSEKPSTPEKAAPKPAEGFSIKSYGFIKLDASYNDSKVTNGNFAAYVSGEGTVRNDDSFNITARQTRVGLDVTAPGFNGWNTKGKVEVDFYGDGSVVHEDKVEPMMRHAFLETSKGGLSILAGQTFDVISPLRPTALNYFAGWSAGNIDYRRPQIRVSYNTSFNADTALLTQFAFSRTTGLANEDLDGGGSNDGDDSGFPTIQGRVALTLNGVGDKKNVIGVSGHYGREEADWPDSVTDYESWSGNIDFVIPLSGRLTWSGEAFTGQNLDDYFGGISQGVNTVTRNEITTYGMWSQLNFTCNTVWQYNAGFGFDDPDDGDINNNMRDKNSFYFINTMFKPLPILTLGLEYSYWETDYKSASEGTANRVQASAIFTW